MTDDDDIRFTATLQATLDALPEQQRRVFLAIRNEDVTYVELGRRLGITVDEVELAFARALVALVRAADG